MDSSRKSQLGLVGLLVVVAASTLALHGLGATPGFSPDWSDPLQWLADSPAEDVVIALSRYIGLGLGYWVLISTSAYTLSSFGPRPRRLRWTVLVTAPAIRRTVDRALATTLAFSIAAAPAGSLRTDAAPSPPPIVREVATDGIPVPHVRIAVTETATVTPDPEAATTPVAVDTNSDDSAKPILSVPAPVTTTPPTPPSAAPATPPVAAVADLNYTVVSGDNLWSISASHLRSEFGIEPDVALIADYWRRAISANAGTLRSGDPNLIYPGEVIALPTPLVSP